VWHRTTTLRWDENVTMGVAFKTTETTLGLINAPAMVYPCLRKRSRFLCALTELVCYKFLPSLLQFVYLFFFSRFLFNAIRELRGFREVKNEQKESKKNCWRWKKSLKEIWRIWKKEIKIERKGKSEVQEQTKEGSKLFMMLFLRFQMRPRISIWGSVRPYVRMSVRPYVRPSVCPSVTI